MNSTPLVSVIIPNYNHARYLDQRIQTVLNQTYQNFEVIILDDCSTDNSLEVIAKYKDNHHVSQVVVNEQNSGSTFKQWDKGIHLANGELIWIAESDDYCELNMLEELVKAMMKKKNVVVAFSSFVIFSDDGYISKAKERGTLYFRSPQFISKRMLRGNVIMNASGAIFNKEIYHQISQNFQTFQSAGDYMFWTEVVAFGEIAMVKKNLTYFRIHTGSVTSDNVSKGVTPFEEKRVFDYICQHYVPSKWQKHIARSIRNKAFSARNFDSMEIKSRILRCWKIEHHVPLLEKCYLLLSHFLENHLEIII